MDYEEYTKILSPIEKIDYVLDYMKNKDQKQVATPDTVAFWINPTGELLLKKEETLIIVRKLIKDGYVDEYKGELIPSKEIKISFEGLLFSGYREQKRIDDLKLSITLKNESRRLKNDCRLILGTWFAGIAALLLLGWQIWIWFYPLHKDFVHSNDVKIELTH